MDEKYAPDADVMREDRYMISISEKYKPTLVLRATEDQERRIRELTPEQLRRFRHIMGG